MPIDSSNPYQTPTTLTLQSPDSVLESIDKIPFQASVTVSDLRWALLSRPTLYIELAVFGLILLVNMLNLLSFVLTVVRNGPANVSPGYLGMPIMLAGWTYIVWKTWSVGERHAKLFPSCIGDKAGWISPKYIYCEDKSGSSQSQLLLATYLRIKHDYLIMAFDPMRSAKSVIPLQSFTDPGAVKEIVKSVRGNLKPVPSRVMDDRLTKGISLPAAEVIPSDAICLQGPILASDLRNTSYPTHIRNASLVALALSSVLIGMSVGIWKSELHSIRFLIFFLILAAVFLWYRILKFIRPLWSGDKIVVINNGYIADSGLRIVNALHDVVCSWSAFQSFRETNGTVMLPLVENTKTFHVLNRRQFQSDEDWQAALALIASKLPMK